MNRITTYGMFGHLHYGHIILHGRAKAFGDLLYALQQMNLTGMGKKHYFTYEQRIALLESIRNVDRVIFGRKLGAK